MGASLADTFSSEALSRRTIERQHVPVEEYKDNLRNIIQHLKYGEKEMKEPERTNEVTGVYPKKCVELANELGLPSIDLWSKMRETEGGQKKILSYSDGLHLTMEGNAIVYQEVARTFSTAWRSAQSMLYDFPQHFQIDGKSPEKAFLQQCPEKTSLHQCS